MYHQYFAGLTKQLLSSACIVDTTPPTFGGITGVIPNNDGSFTVSWSAATTTKPPLRYEVYVALGSISAAILFSDDTYVSKIVPSLVTSTRVFTLPDQTTYFLNGQIYTFGIKALDALSYEGGPANVLTSTAIASGNLPLVFQTIATNMSATEVLLATDHTNLNADHVNFQSDHTNFQTDHTNFQTDHTNFGTDHTNLQSDHSNFQSDHTAFQSDHTAFQSDHTAFGTDHTNFGTDHSNFQTDHTNLNNDHLNLAADHVNFQADHSDLQSDHSNLQSDHTAFQGDHSDLQSDHAAFVIDDTNFQSDHADFQTDHLAFQTIIGNAEVVGGKSMSIETPNLSFTLEDA